MSLWIWQRSRPLCWHTTDPNAADSCCGYDDNGDSFFVCSIRGRDAAAVSRCAHEGRVEGAGKMVAFAEKRADGLMAGLDNQSITLRAQGIKTIDYGYAAYGLNTVGLTIHAHHDTIQANPDMIRRFIRATQKSFQAAMAEPEASIAAGRKVKPDLDAALGLEQLKVGLALMPSPASKDLPLGAFAPQDWVDTVELMKTYQDLQTTMKPEEFYTNSFVAKPGS
jgi:NitT/TauT family transport system substrate-binding protein